MWTAKKDLISLNLDIVKLYYLLQNRYIPYKLSSEEITLVSETVICGFP